MKSFNFFYGLFLRSLKGTPANTGGGHWPSEEEVTLKHLRIQWWQISLGLGQRWATMAWQAEDLGKIKYFGWHNWRHSLAVMFVQSLSLWTLEQDFRKIKTDIDWENILGTIVEERESGHYPKTSIVCEPLNNLQMKGLTSWRPYKGCFWEVSSVHHQTPVVVVARLMKRWP